MVTRPKFDIEKLRKIGFEEWGPMGGGVPADEYDTYLMKAAGNLWNGEAIDQVAEYLVRVEVEWIGLGLVEGMRERAVRAVAAIDRYVETVRVGDVR